MSLKNSPFHSQQSTLYSPSQRFLGTLLSFLLFTRNLPCIHHPNSCIVVWQQLICWLVLLASSQPLYVTYWMSLVHKHWSLCRYAREAIVISSYVLCGVSLLTMTAISVDRLLAMLLGLRYKEIVTLRRTYIILAIFWVVCIVTSLFSHLNYRIAVSSSLIITPSCVVISIASYTKIFCALRHHEAQIQDYAQQQPSQLNALNMARYREAVHNALWVQLALVACHIPQFTMKIVKFLSVQIFSNFFIIHEIANVLMFFNSTLNPFLYCWKISEVRRAVKQTIRQAICYAEG